MWKHTSVRMCVCIAFTIIIVMVEVEVGRRYSFKGVQKDIEMFKHVCGFPPEPTHFGVYLGAYLWLSNQPRRPTACPSVSHFFLAVSPSKRSK